MRTNRSWLCIFGAAFCLIAAPLHAEDGVFQDKILFGQVAALNGPAQALGQGMREGILAAFEETNRNGGINGRKLELKSIDDSYEPEKTIVAINNAISEDKVFALVGAIGTPTSKAGQPIATAAKVPFIGPFTGAEFLRNPFNRYIVNIRSSYFQETEAWIEHLTTDLGITKIAILYQDDAFSCRPRRRQKQWRATCARRRGDIQTQHDCDQVGPARNHEGPAPGCRDSRAIQTNCRIHQTCTAAQGRCHLRRDFICRSDSLAQELGTKALASSSQVVPFHGTHRCPL